MIKKVIRGVLALAGGSAGLAFGLVLAQSPQIMQLFGGNSETGLIPFILPLAMGIIFGLIVYLLGPMIIRSGVRLAKYTELELEKIPTSQVIIGTVGLIPGLMIAYLVSDLYKIIPIPFVSQVLSVVTYIFLGYLGVSIATRNLTDMSRLPDIFRKQTEVLEKAQAKSKSGAMPKILDTSVIIDGRISDISKTGFVEGPIVIPEFVLEELRHIADSSDALKRNRGRRGLDILKVIQQDLDVEVQITDADFEDVAEVDVKLLKLAQKIDGVVVANDYNLNKVADLQGVPVLNINELANSVKPVVLPGETMRVFILKEGKEYNQGVAYLDDGTMVVVENARRLIGKNAEVNVTSVLQTTAGRMIFSKLKEDNEKEEYRVAK